MKKKISFTRLLHHDKLMMIISLVVAILIWSMVVYGPGNIQEMDITGVPVSITLNDYASQTLNLRIVEGANATATVRVRGLRSVLGKLKPQDVTVTADTGNVIKEGTYTLPLSAISNGDYTIVDIVGNDGANDTVTITCDVWREQAFPVVVEMPNLKVADPQEFQFGTPSVGGAAVTDGQVMVAGPKSDIARINQVVAFIPDKGAVKETAVYTGKLKAFDEHDRPIDSITFLQAEDNKVKVTVPVMVYRKVSLKPMLRNVPKDYADMKNLVTVSPSEVELWGVPSELDEYIAKIQQQITVDFDTLNPKTLSKKIVLQEVDGIRPLNGSETIKVDVNLSNVVTRTMEVPLKAENSLILNCPTGFSVKVTQNKLPSVMLCGPSYVLRRIDSDDLRLVVNMEGKALAGQQTVKARLEIRNEDKAWVCYGDNGGFNVLVSITKLS